MYTATGGINLTGGKEGHSSMQIFPGAGISGGGGVIWGFWESPLTGLDKILLVESKYLIVYNYYFVIVSLDQNPVKLS